MSRPDLTNTAAEPLDGSPYVTATGNPDYDGLPEGIKQLHPYDGWRWLSDAEKAGLVAGETEPDY
jgi:hypothetical protein